MFKFVHAADLHLGAAFEGIQAESPSVASSLREATYRALDGIVSVAIEEGAAFVVLAGDLINRAEGNLRAQLALRAAARTLTEAGIAVYIVHGNHDHLDAGQADINWPDGAHVFPAENSAPMVARSQGADVAWVYGRSYPRRDEPASLAATYPKPPSGLFSIGLLHANCGASPDHGAYSPCTPDELAGLGYDYWALGHIHKHTIVRASGPAIVYPGSAQGLNAKEDGPRGCCVVTVESGDSLRVEFRPTDAVRWSVRDVEIGNMNREQELLDRLEQVVRACRDENAARRTCLLRISVVGRGPLHRFLRDPANVTHLTEHLRSLADATGVWTESIRPRTRPDLDLAARREASDFVGTFLRIADSAREDPQALAALGERLKPLFGSAGAACVLGRDYVTDERLREWLERAVVLGADRLVGEEG